MSTTMTNEALCRLLSELTAKHYYLAFRERLYVYAENRGLCSVYGLQHCSDSSVIVLVHDGDSMPLSDFVGYMVRNGFYSHIAELVKYYSALPKLKKDSAALDYLRKLCAAQMLREL